MYVKSVNILIKVLLFSILWNIHIELCFTKQLHHHSRPKSNISLNNMIHRRTVLDRLLHVGHVMLLINNFASPTFGFTINPSPENLSSPRSTSMLASIDDLTTTSSNIESKMDIEQMIQTKKATVLYQPIELNMEEFDVTIPVACWFPTTINSNAESTINESIALSNAQYQHRISVRRIGQLLAGWNFIPNFVSKDYLLEPTSKTTTQTNIHVYKHSSTKVTDMKYSDNIITNAPLIFLSHGYLGSRFDLSHLAEELSSIGYICIAAEYPESLAASYERNIEGLDRSTINDALLKSIQLNKQQWNNIQPTAYGVIGHSLGCGTAIQMGNDDWARILIAGYPRNRDGTPIPGNNLFITSINDSLARNRISPELISACNYQLLSEKDIINNPKSTLPRRAALMFDRPDAPNHISYLCEGVNNAMIEFLSPLLPLAQALSIPVLDFDKYKVSRDSIATSEIVHPLIIRYLQQELSSQR
jgi:hypothetical protein